MKASGGVAALMIVCTAGSAAAATLVVRSAGPSAKSYPPGTAIPDSAKIVLKANDQVVLLDGRGTRTLSGPGSFSPVASTSAAASTQSTFASLVGQRSDRRARIGAVRSMQAGPARSPNVWFVDIDKSATVCVADPTAVSLWSAATPKPDSVTVTGGGATATTPWSKDGPTAPWPAAIPITSGGQYNIAVPGAAQPISMRLVVVGSALNGLEDLASVLIKNGCTAQLDLLIQTVAVPEASAATGG